MPRMRWLHLPGPTNGQRCLPNRIASHDAPLTLPASDSLRAAMTLAQCWMPTVASWKCRIRLSFRDRKHRIAPSCFTPRWAESPDNRPNANTINAGEPLFCSQRCRSAGHESAGCRCYNRCTGMRSERSCAQSRRSDGSSASTAQYPQRGRSHQGERWESYLYSVNPPVG